MKKILIAITALVATMSAFAEGYQINTLSARQEGMGHTGVALKLGAESMIFNPAGLSFSDKTLDITGTVTAIKPMSSATINGVRYDSHNKVSTPIAFNAAFRVRDYLQLGISFYTPYGSAINWGMNWPGAVLNQKVNLATYTVQPTVSWRITPRLSVGAGLMISWGTVDLNKGLVTADDMDKVLPVVGMLTGQSYPLFNGVTPASVNLKGTADMALGFNVGAMFDVSDKVTIGASFRSKMLMKVKGGEAHVSFANEVAKKLLEDKVGLIDQANFSASMPLPYVLVFGASYRPAPRWTVAADIQLTGWKTYRRLDIEFPGVANGAFNQHIDKNYRNAWCLHLGGEWAATEKLDVRAGLMIDQTPVNDNHYNPETPGMTKIEPTVGLSFRPIKQLSVDFSFMYVAGLGKNNVQGSYENFIAKAFPGLGLEQYPVVKGDYRVHAFAPAIGLRYCF